MRRKILKITVFILITMLFVFTTKALATSDNLEDLIVDENASRATTDPIVGADEDDAEEDTELENEEEDSEDAEEEEVSTTGSTFEDLASSKPQNTARTSTYTPQTSQPKTSYSTVATIPEANLSLNNILNVILIAVGVILILLSIAILIRLK